MTEIYRDSTGKGLQFDVAGATVTKVAFMRDGETVAEYTTMPNLNNNVAKIPYAITANSGSFIVAWTYSIEGGTYTRVDSHSVATPLFTKASLTAWDSDFTSLTDQKVEHLERLVREIVETYCNQKFEYYEGPMVFKGNGSATLSSNIRIISANGFNVIGEGYSLSKSKSYNYPTEFGTAREQGYNVKIPIEADMYSGFVPTSKPFADGARFVVEGQFGWMNVPEAVKTAALYLAESFTCDEGLWRERYIKSVRAADWRFDFSEEAFRSTGSLLADQLLDPYVRLGFAVL